MYTINGKFLGRKMMGQIRVAKEIILELDKLVRPGMVEIVAPHSRFDMEGLKNISRGRESASVGTDISLAVCVQEKEDTC